MTTSETQTFWEGHYGKGDRVWSGRANPVLVSTVEKMSPGTALDLGCGEGGDAVWLASRGWRVTASDVSPTAIARGQRAAEAAGVSDLISWEAHDFTVSWPEGTFDLVSAQFLQAPIEYAVEYVLPVAATKVAPGGLLLIVSHASAPSWLPSDHHGHNVRFPTPQETLESLELNSDAWRVDRVEVSQRELAAPDGTPGHLFDSVVAVTRIA
jgi:SAM-dependent methyltransferase